MTACLDLRQTAKAIKVSLPVGGIDTRVLDRVAAVDHHAVSDIDGHMGSTGGVIGPLEEDQVSGLGFASRDDSADVLQAVRCKPADVPAIPAVIDDPGYKRVLRLIHVIEIVIHSYHHLLNGKPVFGKGLAPEDVLILLAIGAG